MSEIVLAEQRLTLLPERAVWWPQEQTLIVTDTHFGKGEAFRHAGLPIPTGSLDSDLTRLSGLIRQWQPSRLLHLGDFYHARQGVTCRVKQRLLEWRQLHPDLAITLVAGNHDTHAGRPESALNVAVETAPCRIGVVGAYHQPPRRVPAGTLAVAGHLHPGVVLKDQGDRLRLPCFHYENRCLILPAFSEFTGMAEMTVGSGSRQWLVADSVHELKV